jgi:pilus assembly protein CpaE
MGFEQVPVDMTAKSEEPWRRNDDRTPGRGPLRVVLMSKELGRAPEADVLAQAGIALQEKLVDIAGIPENAPLFAEADAIIVEIAPGNPSELEAFERLIHISHAEIPVIATVEGLTVGATRTLLRAGASDVLPIPFTVEELRQAVEPARRPVRTAGARPAPTARRHGKVVAFVGAIGGVGTTSLATQAGILWAQKTRVGFLDLDVQFGTAALFLDLRPPLNVGNLIEDAERLDTELLQSVAIQHPSGLEVVASPHEMIPVESVTVDFVDQILRTAVQAYDVVMIDLPTVWTEWTVRALQRADIICLVTNLTVPGIYQTRRQLEVLDANGLTSKLVTIANRTDVNMFGRKTDTRESEAVLGRKIDHSIANDYQTMRSAIDEGRPIKDVRGSSRLAKDILGLVNALGETLASEAVPS